MGQNIVLDILVGHIDLDWRIDEFNEQSTSLSNLIYVFATNAFQSGLAFIFYNYLLLKLGYLRQTWCFIIKTFVLKAFQFTFQFSF